MARYSGYLLVSRLQSDLNRLFEVALRPTLDGRRAVDWLPPADVSETEREVLIRLEVPGVRRRDLSVSVSGGELTIAGSKELKPPDGGRFHCMERGRGSFQRSLPMAAATDPTRAEARLVDGLLTITLPRIDERRDRPVEIAIRAEEDPVRP